MSRGSRPAQSGRSIDATPPAMPPSWRMWIPRLHAVAIQVRLRIGGAVFGVEDDLDVALQPQRCWEIVRNGHGDAFGGRGDG